MEYDLIDCIIAALAVLAGSALIKFLYTCFSKDEHRMIQNRDAIERMNVGARIARKNSLEDELEPVQRTAAGRAKRRDSTERAKENQEEDDSRWEGLLTVEQEGQVTEEEETKLVDQFVKHVKMHKVVLLEDLATLFDLRTTDTVKRLAELEQMGRISGLLDDRGKYIYISPEEMKEVASFINRKGRISKTELAVACNRMIKLEPTPTDSERIVAEERNAEAGLSDLEDV